ncbi:uncharacterized protein At4g15545-like [Vigna unguiculata]|uniref:WAT1-related protein n=1 Tax=Vigna unguiculata TaxID=3917 RepID=A0A4D6KQT6_VIGUN|nr:uncharacterized protein At4g15545-like [Vigna unguiculata]QCD77041.1 WAT1-related protein [Vigna unguiculata]
MLVVESSGSRVDLPEELLQVLPSDPYEQLDVARKITSVALSTRVNALQSESSTLRAELADRERLIAELQAQVDSFDAALSEAADKLARADQDKESLVKENASLSNSVRKLTRDVSKLESFRRTLMKSLHEDGDTSGGAADIAAKLQSQASISSSSQFGDEDASAPSSRSSSMRLNTSDSPNYSAEDRESDGSRSGASHNVVLASQSSTPRITPPGSPPSKSALVSPTRTSSKPVSPRRHAMSFSTSRGMFDDRSSSQTARTRVDGKEFFRQVRSRLSYEQFGAFLANVKELNSHKQTKEETLQNANEIFGTENKDLYTIFEGLITRNVH